MRPSCLIYILIFGYHCLIFGCGNNTESPVVQELQALEGKLDAILAHSSKSASVSPQLDELKSSITVATQRIESLEKKIELLQQSLQQSEDISDRSLETEIEFRSLEEAKNIFAKLGNSPTAEQLARALETVDEWIVKPDEHEPFQAFKMAKAAELREKVRVEVESLHNEALKSNNGAKALDFHAKASRILALYPMDSTPSVLDEARSISSRHAKVAERIDDLRRQRYNAWALTCIEAAFKEINAVASSLTTSDNPKVIEATVKHLGEIDPVLLEPVVAQLYNHVVELAKSHVNSEQRFEIGRRLIDPSLMRKKYGDF